MIDLFQRLPQLRGLVFVHADLHLFQGFNQKFSARKDGINILFEINIPTFSRVVDDSCPRCLGTQFQALENGAVIGSVVRADAVLPCFRRVLGGAFFFLEGVFEVIIQRFNGVVPRRRGFFFHGLEVDVYDISFFQFRQNFILLREIVVLGPALFQYRHPFEHKGFQCADVDCDFGSGHHAVLFAEHRDKSAEYRGIDLHFPLRKLCLLGNLISRRERGVRFDFAVIKDGFAVLEGYRVADLFTPRKDLTDFVLFRRCEVFGVGSGIGQIALFVEPLYQCKAFLHGHLIFLTENILKLGERIEFSREQLLFFVFDRRYDCAGCVVLGAGSQCVVQFVCVKPVFGGQFNNLSPCLFFADHCVIFSGDKIADGKVAVINRLDNRDDDAPDAQQSPGFQRSVARQIHAVEPVDIGSRKAFRSKQIVFPLVFHVLQRGGNGLRGLIGKPETAEGLRRLQGVFHAEPHDDLPFPIRVSRVYHGFDIGAVAERTNDLKLADYAAVGLTVFPFPQLKAEGFGKAREVVHRPFLLSVGRRAARIGFDVAQRKEMPECPCDKVSASLEIAVPFLHLTDSRNDVARKTRLFRDNQNHIYPLLSKKTAVPP